MPTGAAYVMWDGWCCTMATPGGRARDSQLVICDGAGFAAKVIRTACLRLGSPSRAVSRPDAEHREFVALPTSADGRRRAAYVVGGGRQADEFPTTTGALQPNLLKPGGREDIFVKLTSRKGAVILAFSHPASYAIRVEVDQPDRLRHRRVRLRPPISPGAYRERAADFVTKLAPTASLVYSTYLGNGASIADIAANSCGRRSSPET